MPNNKHVEIDNFMMYTIGSQLVILVKLLLKIKCIICIYIYHSHYAPR